MPTDLVRRALRDPIRREMLRRLVDHEPLTSASLAGDLPVSREAVAYHAKVLAEAGLVRTSRGRGRQRSVLITLDRAAREVVATVSGAPVEPTPPTGSDREASAPDRRRRLGLRP